MLADLQPPLGVIEGFFGACWSWPERHQLVDFLRARNFQFYLYAPKADVHLRRHWRRDWPASEARALHLLREHCGEAGVDFGLGLSPLDLCQHLEGEGRDAFTQRLRELNRYQVDILCLLFDDMRGDLPQLAETQAALVAEARAVSNAQRIILCPTYYSDDPVLERVFGQRPEHYWETLGQTLAEDVDIFWTGPQVCSQTFSRDHLQDVAQRLGRKPFLWDNYPVNDGAKMSRHLHLRPFSEDRAQLGDLVSGHAANPMNQFHLSLLALASLPLAHRRGRHYQPEALYGELLDEICGAPLAQALLEDAALLQDEGLDGIDESRQRTLLEKYSALPDSGFRRELIDWLQGKYAFDPACLTD